MLVVSILSHAKTETMVSNPDSLKTKESRDSTIYADFEFPAEFPGGQEALKEYLKKEFRYTSKSLKKITCDIIILGIQSFSELKYSLFLTRRFPFYAS